MSANSDFEQLLRQLARGTPVEAIAPGQTLAGRYRIDALVGAGGMGRVYRARDERDDRTVAVKLVGSEHRRRFLREVEVLAQLDHPHVVTYLDHGETAGGTPLLVMEWLDGEDLASRLSAGALELEQALQVARGAAAGLGAAHRAGVVHRDIKPSNLFLVAGDPAATCVLDFGIAQGAQLDRTITATGAVIGTVGYMAPEQARGSAGVDSRSDVFSLGCVIYECLFGEPAFAGVNAVAVLAKILEAPPPRLEDGLAPDLRDLLVAMLNKSPDCRPRDGAEVLRRLDRLANGGARPSLEPSSQLGQEQRLVSVLLVEPPARWLAAAQTMEAPEQRRLGNEIDELAASCGAQAHWLRNGTLLVTVEDLDGAVDQAAPIARCALALRERLDRMRGAVVLGRKPTGSGSPAPVGPLIDRAAEMLVQTEASSVAVDEATAALLVGRYAITESESGTHYLAGAAPPLDVRRTLAGKPTRCEGRNKELALLEATLEECIEDGVARAVLVTGAAGVGKSRLGSELGQRAHDRARVFTARAEALRAGSPWFVVRQIVGQLLGLESGGVTALERLREHLVDKSDPEEEWHQELLADWLGLLAADAASARLRAARQDPTEMRRELQEALSRLLRVAAKRERLVLLVDDLQWGDASSVAALRRAVIHDESAAMMLVALARPEIDDSHPALVNDASVTHLRLRNLSRGAVERLARSVLADADDEMVAAIAERAGGNALFAEELIRQAARGEHPTTPPTSVLALLERRLSALAPDVRRALRAASVFGETSWGGGIETIAADLSPEAVTAALEVLVREEIVSQRIGSRFSSTSELAFRHALIRDAAYAMVPEGERQIAHGVAARWLEESGESDPLLLAEHWSRSDTSDHAIPLFEQAAQRALVGGSLEEVALAATRGIELGANGDQRGRLLLLQCEELTWRGDFATLARVADEALRLVDPSSIESFVLLSMLGIAIITGHQGEARHSYLAGCESFDAALEPSSVVGLAMTRHVTALAHLGRPDLALALVDRFDAAARRAAPDDDLARGYRLVVDAFHEHHVKGGEPGAADRVAEGRACFERIGHRLGMRIADVVEGATAYGERDTVRARAALERCRSGEIATTDHFYQWATHYLGYVDLLEGDEDAARNRFEQLAKHSHLTFRCYAECALAQMCLRRRELDRAAHHVACALRLADPVLPYIRPAALAIQASLDAIAGRHDEGRRHVEEGLALFQRVGGHPAVEKGLRRVESDLATTK